MPKLIFSGSTLAGKKYDLVVERTTVGRGEQNTLVINDPSLSTVHCEILVNGSEVIVHDLGSRNGTIVNGHELRGGQAELKHGQTVRFGAVEARLELEESSDTQFVNDITAVHAFSRAIRDQRRAEKNPAPANPSQHLGPMEEDAGSTVVVTKPTALAKPAIVSNAPPEPVASPKRKLPLWILVVVTVVVAAVVWRLVGSR